MATQIKIRRDTAANWTSSNPVLAQGEIGYETDTRKGKIGNGSSTWTALAYTLVDDLPTLLAAKAPLASPTFTGTPAAPTAAVGTNTTQIATTAFVLANVPSAGLDYITTSTMTSTTTASINNCFTTTYDAYRILIRLTATNGVTMRLRASGTDSTSSNYYTGNSTAATSWMLTTDVFPLTVTMDIFQPATATNTRALHVRGLDASTGVGGVATTAHRNDLSNAFDGFSIIGTTALTGTITVYGYHI